MLNLIHKTADYIIKESNFIPEIGIILGTGLGGLVEEIDIKKFYPLANLIDKSR